MLPMSHCCSCISDYVHCTEIIFPFNATSLSIEQAQCSAQQCMSLGWGWFPAGAPDSIACCPGQCLAAKELSSQGAVPRHCWSQARQPLGSSSWTQLQHPTCMCSLYPTAPF